MNFDHAGSATAAVPSHTPARMGHRALLCVPEPLDLDGANRLLHRAEPLRHNCRVLVVDLQRADFIDSSGVRALLALAEQLEAEEKELHLVIPPQSAVERTLELLGLQERLHAYPTLESAWPSDVSSN